MTHTATYSPDKETTMDTTKTLLKLNQFLSRDNAASAPEAQPASYGQFDCEIPGPYSTVYEMERANIRSGGHYFDRAAKRFFRSRINDQVFHGRFFIDSIQFVSSRGEKAARKYKIRALLDDGRTSSVIARDRAGNWTEDFPTLDSAKRALARLVERGE